jgi:hypothetical protein
MAIRVSPPHVSEGDGDKGPCWKSQNGSIQLSISQTEPSVYTERDRRCHLGTKAPASAFWASPRMLLWTALQVLEFIEHELPKMVVRTISLAEHRYHPLTRHGASVSLVNPSALPVLHSLWVCISHVPVRYNRTTPYCTSLPHAARDWTQPGCGATEEKRFLKIRRAVRDLLFFCFWASPFPFPLPVSSPPRPCTWRITGQGSDTGHTGRRSHFDNTIAKSSIPGPV